MINEDVIKKMKVTHEEFEGVSLADIKALVTHGHVLLGEDEEALDSGVVRSHYQMTEHDKNAMSAAAIYNISSGKKDPFLEQYLDEEE